MYVRQRFRVLMNVYAKISVVYTADGDTLGRSRGRRALIAILGAANLAAAAALYYVAWWPIDNWMVETYLLEAPFVPASEMAQFARLFRINPAEVRNGAADSAQLPPPPVEPPALNSLPAPWLDRTPWRIRIPGRYQAPLTTVAMYGWLTLAALAVWTLALAGGACVGAAGGWRIRSVGKVVAPVGVVALAAWGAYVWVTKQTQFSVDDGRLAIAGVAAVCALAALASGRHPVGWVRVAAIMVILSAMGTAAGLWLAACCDTLSGERASLGFMLKASALHAAFGVFLLAASLFRRDRPKAGPPQETGLRPVPHKRPA